ncbi:MAG: ferredoxin--NADP reductase [Rhodoblastus sp.]
MTRSAALETQAAAPEAASPPKKAGAFNRETVTYVRQFTDRLFTFRTTRDAAFRYENGQFVMIGLEVEGRPLLRAYSMASANYEDELEFYSIKVENGPLTSRLRYVKVGDQILVGRKPTGTLVQSSLLPGKRLYLLSTGTGVAPFASIVRDPEIYDRYEKIVLVHGCRQIAELEYGADIVKAAQASEFLGELAREKLVHYPTVTREDYVNTGRITSAIESGRLFEKLDVPALDPAHDRVMICGGPEVLADLQALLDARGFEEGSGGKPASYVIEKAFAER